MPAVALRIEEPALRTCIEKYTRELCRRWRVSHIDANDVLQDVLTEVHASLASFQPERGELVAWTRGIAWKVIRRHVQKAKQHAQLFSEYHSTIDDHPAPDPSPERCVQQRQAQDAISSAMENLEPQHVDIFVLKVVDDFTHVEIGEQLQVSPANSQKCFQRTRDHLARCLRGKVLVAMPPDVVGCNDSNVLHVRDSRWSERSHYALQVGTLIMAIVLALSMKSTTTKLESANGEAEVSLAAQNVAMYDLAKPSVAHDEPSVLHDAPSGKPEPASLPSVRAVSKPTGVGDKPTYIPQLAPLPPYKHKPRSWDHWHLGR